MESDAPPFSHRDRRAHRLVWKWLAALSAGVLALGALALTVPSAALDVAALVGLAALGGAGGWAGERAVAEYDRDLRAAASDSARGGFVRVEVRSTVGLERSVGLPSTRSPLHRPSARPPDPRPGSAGWD